MLKAHTQSRKVYNVVRRVASPLPIFLFVSLFIYLLLTFLFGFQSLSSRFDAEATAKLYSEIVEAAEKGIFLVKPGAGDDTLYAYAGWRYMQGVSPDQILFEHPPLGKYLIGLSIAVFGNQNMLGFILGACTLILLYLTAAELGGRGVITLAPVLLALDRLFITFSHISFLDIYMLFFLTLSTYLFTKALKQTKLLIPFSIAYGLAVACKWTAAFLILPLALTLVIKRRWSTLTYLAATIPLSLAAYTATYLIYFTSGHTIQDFINLQYQMLQYQEARRYLIGFVPGELLINLQTGITFLNVLSGLFNPLLWPLILPASALSIIYYISKREGYRDLLPPITTIGMLTPFLHGQVYIWYLLPTLTIGYLTIANTLQHIYEDAKRKKLAAAAITAYIIAAATWSITWVGDIWLR